MGSVTPFLTLKSDFPPGADTGEVSQGFGAFASLRSLPSSFRTPAPVALGQLVEVWR